MNRITMAILAIMACLWLYSLPVLALPEGAVARLGKGMISLQKRPIALSPDGSLLAVATSLGIYLYNTTTYVEIGFIETDEGMSSVAFSPDGHLLAGGGLDDRIPVKLWDVSGLQLVKTLTDTYHYSCYSVVFSPDGQLLATCSLLSGSR